MPQATDPQMQAYMDARLRTFAELLRKVFALRDDNFTAIADVFIRAASGPLWSDNRTDGPPVLLKAGATADPDCVLNFNILLDLLDRLKNGTFQTLDQANSFKNVYAILLTACVRPLQINTAV